MNFAAISFGVESGVARIALNRPDVGNVLDADLARELSEAALRCDNDPTIRCVLISAKGRMFCAGGDLRFFSSLGDQARVKMKSMADDLHKAISTFARMSPPVVIAVNGMAAGAGFSFALIGDYVIAAESAKFTMAYTAAGLTPDGSSTYYLTRLVGLRRAQELAFTNRTLSAQEALNWGLVTRVVDDLSLHSEAEKIAGKLAAGPKASQAIVKQLFLSSLRNGLEEQMEIEGREISGAAMSADGQEGIHAFLEKRKPNFQ